MANVQSARPLLTYEILSFNWVISEATPVHPQMPKILIIGEIAVLMLIILLTLN